MKLSKQKQKKCYNKPNRLKAKKIIKERKERARELIKIGAAFAQFHDRKELLEYLKNPDYLTIDENGKIIKTNHVKEGQKGTIFINPNIAQKK